METIFQKFSVFVSNRKNLKDLEIEAKLFPVDESDLDMLKDYFSSNFPSDETFSTDYYKEDNTRITELDDNFYNTSKESLFLEKVNYKDFTIKLTVSKEENTLLKTKKPKSYSFKREKTRTSYFDENIRYDITKVVQYPSEIETSELEVEIINSENYDNKKFIDSISFLISFISSYKKDIIRFCNCSLSEGKDESDEDLEYYLISKPRDFKKRDFTSPDAILRDFKVSIKADGVQYFLLFHKSGIWLISQTKENIRLCGLEKEFLNLENSLFAGEVLTKDELKKGEIINSEIIFIPFDTISYKNQSVVNKTYTERCSYFKEIIKKFISCDGVKKMQIIEKKIFDLGNTSKTFYKGFKQCFDNRKEIIYKDDGYIFTPDKSPYVAEGQNKKPNERFLDKNLDVCKFKPVEKRSLDFKVVKGKLYYKDGKNLINFNKLKYSLDFEEDLEGKIVEFFPKFSEDKNVSFFPSRIRSDKIYPNKKSQVEEIVNSYKESNPITEQTLLGKDTVLMRDFNNKIKIDLINSIEGYVVDIGSGKGGDIMKFGINSKIKKVLSIEPNIEFSKEFSKRLKTTNLSKKFKLLSGVRGEDSETISKNLLDFLPENMKMEKLTVTFMISLSFFWSSNVVLDNLARTLNDINNICKGRGGENIEIIFFTIDGEKVEKMFSSYGKNSIKLNTIYLTKAEDNQVMVHIEDSKTVSNQIEYLVKLDKLFDKAGMEKIYLKSPKVEKDLLMSVSESIYISLFVYGKFKLTGNSNLDYELQRKEVNVKKGTSVNGKILAKGDDELYSMSFIDPDLYRISTMDLNMSLSNSISKLTNKEYRDSDVYKRKEIAKELNSKIKNKNLNEISNIIGYGIKVFDGKKTINFGEDKENWIFLNKCYDGTYEPVVYKKDTIEYIFPDDSYLIDI